MGRSLVIGGWGAHLGDRASALLDGQLGPEESERAWAHVQECHACRDQIEREGWLKRRLAGLSYDPLGGAPESLKGSLLGAPGDVFFGFHAELHHAEHPHARSKRTLGLAAIGGGAVGAAVMGVLAFGAAPASAPTPPLPAAALSSVAPTPIVATLRKPAPTP